MTNIEHNKKLIKNLCNAANEYRRCATLNRFGEVAISAIVHTYPNLERRGPSYTAGFANGILVMLRRADKSPANGGSPDVIGNTLFALDIILPTLDGEAADSFIQPLIEEFNGLTEEIVLGKKVVDSVAATE